MSRQLRHYLAYGLRLDSDIDLPWPAAPPFDGDPDIAVRIGAVPQTLASPVEQDGYWQATSNAFLLNVDGNGRYLVTDGGRRVRVAAAENGGTVRVCQFDSVVAACLQMRGILTLHGTAIATAAGAVLFAGPAGIGKSSLAATLIDCGYALLADELVGVACDDAPPRALGGFPRIRLWADAMKNLDDSWRRSAAAPVHPGIENYAVPTPRFCGEELPVHTVYLLSGANETDIAVKPVAPARAFAALVEVTYRMRPLFGLGQSGRHFRAVSAVVRHGVVERIRRPRGVCPPAALAERLAERLPPPA